MSEHNELVEASLKISEPLYAISDLKLPHEVLVLNEETTSIVIDVDGVDYILTVMKVPAQRERETVQ